MSSNLVIQALAAVSLLWLIVNILMFMRLSRLIVEQEEEALAPRITAYAKLSSLFCALSALIIIIVGAVYGGPGRLIPYLSVSFLFLGGAFLLRSLRVWTSTKWQ